MNKTLKSAITAATIGLTGILGTTAKAEEPTKQTYAEKLYDEWQKKESDTRKQKAVEIGAVIAETAASYLFIANAIHETGHALAGLATGTKIKEYHPYAESGSVAGYVTFEDSSYHSKPTAVKAGIEAAGMLTTRLVAEGLDALMNHTELPQKLNQALAVLYFANRFEAVDYFMLSAIGTLGNNPTVKYGDVDLLVSRVTKDPKKKKMVYAGLAALIAADIALDAKEIRRNWNRLWTNYPFEKKEESKGKLSVKPTEGGAMLNFAYNF